MQRTRNQLSNGSTVIGYVRVSTEDQAGNGISLDAQRHRIEAYCAAHGLTLARVEQDAGISAKRTTNRPASTTRRASTMYVRGVRRSTLARGQ